MNPLAWRRERLVAWLVICLIGAMAGLLFGWFQSPFYRMAQANLSGMWANSALVVLAWLQNVNLYWPWPAFGALIAGLAYYAAELLRISK
jgi:hypothetical protein